MRPSDNPSRKKTVAGLALSDVNPIITIAVLVSAAMLLMPPPNGIPPLTWLGLPVLLLPVVLWATGAVPEYFPSLLLFFLALVLGVASTEVVFSGFHSQAAWLVFSGIVIGQAVQKTGLAKRLVNATTRRFGGTYALLIAGLALTGFASAFFIPSAMGRAVLLTPIALAIADRFGHMDHSRGRTGIILATILGSTVPSFAILPANIPNLVMSGAAEQIYSIEFGYAGYLLLNLPILGSASLVISCLLVTWLFGARNGQASDADVKPGSWPVNQRLLASILLATVALWVTDSIHGISPAWVALGAALACLFPGVGILKADEFIKTVNLGPWIFVAGIIGLGAVAAGIGVDTMIARHLEVLVPTGDFGAFMAVVLIGIGTSVLTNHPASPALVTPLAGALSEITGWPLESVLYAQVPGWVVFPFAYQVPPLVVALSLARIPMRTVVPFFLIYFVVSVLTVLPMQFLWGSLLGYYQAP